MTRVHILGQLPPPLHGSSYSAVLLREELTRAGHTVTVTSKSFSTDAAHVGALEVGKVLKIPSLLWRLLQDLRRARPEVVIHYTTNRPGSFLVDALMLVLLRAICRRPVIGYLHTVGFSRLAARGWAWSWLVHHHLASFTHLVTLGPSITVDIERLTRRPITVIRNAAPEQPPTAGREDADARITVGHLSNLTVAKGSLAFIHLVESSEEVRGLLAGPIADEAVARALDAGEQRHLTHLGPVHGDAKARFFAALDVFVFPSTYEFEAQPFVIIEALAAGIAVIAYDTGGIGDLVQSDLNGLLVKPGDQSALASALHRLTHDPELLARLKAHARESFDTHHSLTSFRASWSTLITDLGEHP